MIGLVCAGVQLAGMSLYGVRQWCENADAFAVYFGLFGKLVAAAVATAGLYRRPPATAIVALDAAIPGTVALVLVSIGTTSFDSFLAGQHLDVDRAAADHLLRPSRAGRAVADRGRVSPSACSPPVAIIAGFYHLGIAGMRSAGPDGRPPRAVARVRAHPGADRLRLRVRPLLLAASPGRARRSGNTWRQTRWDADRTCWARRAGRSTTTGSARPPSGTSDRRARRRPRDRPRPGSRPGADSTCRNSRAATRSQYWIARQSWSASPALALWLSLSGGQPVLISGRRSPSSTRTTAASEIATLAPSVSPVRPQRARVTTRSRAARRARRPRAQRAADRPS